MAQVTVLFFSYAADRMSGRLRTYEVAENLPLAQFFDEHLAERLGEPLTSFMFSVNAEWVDPAHPLKDGDELAVIPPVSGG